MDDSARPRVVSVVRWVLVVICVALVSGCAAADKTHAKRSAMAGMSAKQMAAMGSPTASSGKSQASAQAAQAGDDDASAPIPTQPLGTADWQGMKISAMAMTPVPFVVDNGDSESEVKPTVKTTFHLMVMLNDAVTNEPIPYSTVWATIRRHGHVVFNERQWPMISRYLGPHYGNDVTLPGPGTYQLSLLITPPVSARHMEYAKVWLKPHTAVFTFSWRPAQ